MLTEEDLALVHALQEAPRASWARLSSSIGTDARALARRYTRLHEAGLLRVMATAGPRLLERLVFAHLRLRTAPGQARGAAEQIARWPQASNVRLTDGSHDVHALLVGADHACLMGAARSTVAAVHSVQRAELSTVVATGDLGRAARLDALSPGQTADLRRDHVRPARPGKPAEVGRDDFELLGLLLRDGRCEVAELATHLGRDPSVVSRRLGRLQREGFVDIVTITPDTASSSPVRALLWCRVDPGEVPDLLHRAAALPWVGMLTATSGRANVVAVANLTSRAHLPMIQAELASVSPSLRFAETQLSHRAVKLHMRTTTGDDRLTDDVADPFRALRDELVGA